MKIKDTESEFAAIIDENAEELILVDSSGKIIMEDLFQALIALILFRTTPGATFFSTITSSEILDKLAERYSGTVKRTKNCTQAIMDEILSYQTVTGTSAERYVTSSLEDFRPNQLTLSFDAIEGLIRIIEYMCYAGTTLNEILSEIPDFFMVKKNLRCPWESKGAVMRKVINDYRNKGLELLDGIKLHTATGWVLIVPDADKPIFKIITESSSNKNANELCDKYCTYLENIINNAY